jgi:cytochrome P450
VVGGVRERVSGEAPPSVRGPVALQTLAWAVAPTWLMDRCGERLGETFRLSLGVGKSSRSLVMISDPEAVKTVFTAPGDVAPSAAGSSPIAGVLGRRSVIVLTGPEHMRQRKLLLGPFHGERMREYEEVMVQATEAEMAGWKLGRPMRLGERTQMITLEVIVRAVFGVEAERMGPLKEAITAVTEPIQRITFLLSALRRPSDERPPGAMRRSLERLDGLIYEEIAGRRREGDLGERTDILSLLLQARDEDGEQMTDGELRDELVSLLLAGHETTATSVGWAVERLVRHPEKLERLQGEIDEVGRIGGKYMTAVVNETLRVRPVVPIVVRELREELAVGGYRLEKGTYVAPCIYLTNRNPRIYEDPQAFRPERFLEDGPETFSWIPFGGGIRRCIGASFAQVEMKLILGTILSELTPVLRGPRLPVPRLPRAREALGGRRGRGGEWMRRRAITLVPGRGVRVAWERRHT